ncbi:bromodomain-containing protein-like isoform X2 [Iris pallida]|uniref:Bromodomain-containing protein-like isoform X2 n=1 Tax=Iris pallida TaxID=29817 RepID=A0AAX6HH75_IRIPA|nr:bromodomain-containing protein-like isoform X2 [Iris pallida]
MKKKKGRPSLLDLQKRSLRLQKQQQQQNAARNPNPNPKSRSRSPNPYLKFPNPSAPARRTARRGANPDDDDDEERDAGGGKRKEKKLDLVLQEEEEEGGGSDSEEEGSAKRRKKKRKIDSLETGGQKSSSKATDARGEEDPSDSGPTATTPLPDKKLLEFILDRLQKKDTYGVFSEPVGKDELPDYHDIIEHPMDFGTVRTKLSGGAYACLEQFESDVFLISSNAMRYNAQDTIYYRQARSIQELAKKDFESLRQESDNETEPQTVRRGRPPVKDTIKRMLGKPADRTICDVSSNATLANSRDDTRSNPTNDLLRKRSSFDKLNMVDSSTRVSHTLRYNQTHRSNGDQKSECLGSSLKGISMRNWKKQSVSDENRRDTYNQALLPISQQKQSILSVFDSERELLVPVGFHGDHSYARSLARFAANLGPVGWEVAARKIERALPPGTKFGRGWVGDSEAPPSQSQLFSASPHLSTQVKLLLCSTPSAANKLAEIHEPSPNDSAPPLSASDSAAPTPSRSSDSMEGAEACKIVNTEGKFGRVESGAEPTTPLQFCKNSSLQPSMNGFNSGFGVNLQSQAGKNATLTGPPEEMMAHARVLNMVCRNGNSFVNHHQSPLKQVAVQEKMRLAVGNQTNSGNTTLHPNNQSEGQLRALSRNSRPGSIPPDLNVDFQSPGSPVSGMLLEPQRQQQQQKQPDLALQL